MKKVVQYIGGISVPLGGGKIYQFPHPSPGAFFLDSDCDTGIGRQVAGRRDDVMLLLK